MKKFENAYPLDTLSAALNMLLNVSMEHRVRRVLTDKLRDQPYIERMIYNGPLDSLSARELISVTPEVVRQLREKRYVEGTPELGFTDDTRLLLTSSGISAACNLTVRSLNIETADGKVLSVADRRLITVGTDPDADFLVPEVVGMFMLLYEDEGWELADHPLLKGELVFRNFTLPLGRERWVNHLNMLVEGWLTFGATSFKIYPGTKD